MNQIVQILVFVDHVISVTVTQFSCSARGGSDNKYNYLSSQWNFICKNRHLALWPGCSGPLFKSPNSTQPAYCWGPSTVSGQPSTIWIWGHLPPSSLPVLDWGWTQSRQVAKSLALTLCNPVTWPHFFPDLQPRLEKNSFRGWHCGLVVKAATYNVGILNRYQLVPQLLHSQSSSLLMA